MEKTKSYDTEFHVINHITWSSKKKFLALILHNTSLTCMHFKHSYYFFFKQLEEIGYTFMYHVMYHVLNYGS